MVEFVEQLPAFSEEMSITHIKKASSDTGSFEYVVTAHMRMSGIYWGLTTMCLLGKNLKEEMGSEELCDWVMTCYHADCGGFGGGTEHDAHMLYTLSALQILALCGELNRVDKDMVCSYIKSMQLDNGSFQGDIWGEVDTRFSYCALQCLAIIGCLPTLASAADEDLSSTSTSIDIAKAVHFIAECINFDGGFGAVPTAESHAGQIFCCVGALSIAQALHVVDVEQLGWWLAERQCDSGGLNGRPEKQADVCYSWWILSSLSILGKIKWIDGTKLTRFILECQDPEDGGFADRPGNMGDIFHTFFAIAGLHLLGYFKEEKEDRYSGYRPIDPTYALPCDVVKALGLPAQVL
jgi:geranylgeranyl transferase type-2 subunit beta